MFYVVLPLQIDLEKMPLGKISKKQIKKAYEVLKKIQELQDIPDKEDLVTDYSNEFYTLIHHNFGLNKPPVLNNEELLQVLCFFFIIILCVISVFMIVKVFEH